MACGRVIGSLGAFRRVTAISTTTAQFFPSTKWLPCTGLQARAWVNMLDEGGDGVIVRPALQYAQVVSDQPAANGGRGDWAGLGSAVNTEGIHAFGDLSLQTQYQWVRGGFEVLKDTGTQLGQADVSVMFEVKPCGKVIGTTNVAGLEADATRELAMSEWVPTVDVNNVRIGYLLDAESAFRMEWFIQTANDTNRPNQPASLGLTAVNGAGSGTYTSGNTGDVDISGFTSPATATQVPAFVRLMARISTTGGGPASADQLLVNVQVS